MKQLPGCDPYSLLACTSLPSNLPLPAINTELTKKRCHLLGDWIDMHDLEANKELVDRLKLCCAHDREAITIFEAAIVSEESKKGK